MRREIHRELIENLFTLRRARNKLVVEGDLLGIEDTDSAKGKYAAAQEIEKSIESILEEISSKVGRGAVVVLRSVLCIAEPLELVSVTMERIEKCLNVFDVEVTA